MRMFYEQWKLLDTNLADASAKFGEIENVLVPNALVDIPIAAFFSIGFSHHVMILSKTKTFTERKYYIQLCADLQLSHEALERAISEDTYHNQGKMTNNFANTMPDYKQAFRAIQMFKLSYPLKETKGTASRRRGNEKATMSADERTTSLSGFRC